MTLEVQHCSQCDIDCVILLCFSQMLSLSSLAFYGRVKQALSPIRE